MDAPLRRRVNRSNDRARRVAVRRWKGITLGVPPEKTWVCCRRGDHNVQGAEHDTGVLQVVVSGPLFLRLYPEREVAVGMTFALKGLLLLNFVEIVFLKTHDDGYFQ